MNLLLRKSLFHLVNRVSRTFFASRLSYAHIRAFLFNNSLRKLANLLHVYRDVRRGTEVTDARPYILILETTNLCNLHCPFCLTGKGISGGRERRHMNFEEARRIIDDVADTVYLLQLYTWGEPLLNKETLRIIEYAKTKNLCVMLSTNATAMTPAYNERLIEAGADYITVAIDGGSAESYARYRQGGDFERVMSNLRDMLKRKRARRSNHPFIEWQFIVFRHNEHEVKRTEQEAYAMGIDKFTPLPAYVEDESWLPEGPEYRTEMLNPERLKNCARPWSHLNVRADGGVAPCCYEFFKRDDFGELREGHFDDVWNNTKFQESRRLIRRFRTGRPEHPSELICYECMASGVRPSYLSRKEAEEESGAVPVTLVRERPADDEPSQQN